MRTGTLQKGKFDIKPGMAFVMPDMIDLIPNGHRIEAQKHPWLITEVYDDYVEIIMGTTITSKTEDKHRLHGISNTTTSDLTDPCPPMDRNEKRTSGIVLDTFITMPKKTLFSHKIKLLNENTATRNFTTEGKESLCMSEKQITAIRDEINNYITDNPKYVYDIFQCERYATHLDDLKAGYTKDLLKGFSELLYTKKFGWKHLPDANPLAIYPFKDQMHHYERADPELIRIAEEKKSRKKPVKDRGKSAETATGYTGSEHLSHTDTADLSLR